MRPMGEIFKMAPLLSYNEVLKYEKQRGAAGWRLSRLKYKEGMGGTTSW